MPHSLLRERALKARRQCPDGDCEPSDIELAIPNALPSAPGSIWYRATSSPTRVLFRQLRYAMDIVTDHIGWIEVVRGPMSMKSSRTETSA